MSIVWYLYSKGAVYNILLTVTNIILILHSNVNIPVLECGPALTAVWSKAPPLTVRCLSPLPGFESRRGHVRKLPVTWS